MPEPLLWPLEPATEAKHRLYKRYLDAWWPIMLQSPHIPRVTYVDAFAGPGEYEGGADGSPIFAIDRLLNHVARERMNLRRDRVSVIFIEERRDRKEHLEALIRRRFGDPSLLPITVIVEHGRAEQDTIALLDRVGAWGAPILAIFDSWGNVAVPLRHIAGIAHNRSSETIVTFGPHWFSRRENLNPEKLDVVFGGAQYWSPSSDDLDAESRWREWLETYRAAMVRAGHQFPLTFELRPRTGQPLYLVFGTGSPKGVKVFKDAMWDVDTSDGMRFNDPRTTAASEAVMALMQPTLFEDPYAPDTELLLFVIQLLTRGPAKVEKIGDFLLLETSRWRVKDAGIAVRHLVSEGRVARWPETGRLTRQTLLRLVA